MMKIKSKRNKTIVSKGLRFSGNNKEIICGDCFDYINKMSDDCIDLLILDPPYNLSKKYGDFSFSFIDEKIYQKWFKKILSKIEPKLKSTSTIYVCSDWRTSNIIFPVLDEHYYIKNRITWERDKGRGAKTNWKNNTEDIWFCTVDKNIYCFNIDDIKLKKKVIAPYVDKDNNPKDWKKSSTGEKYRMTYPSNIWTDITIPFWSMSENTEHSTQKPEKLIAKLVLASSKEGDFIFDPFSGSGTTGVVCKKLNRKFLCIEQDEGYCAIIEERLRMAENNKIIQGYKDNVFLERNSK